MTTRTRNTIIIAVAVIALWGLFVAGTLVGAAVISYRAATRAGNEVVALQNLKTIGALEVQYFENHNRTYATMEQLVDEQMLHRKFSGHPVVVDGYVFTLTLSRKSDSPSWFKITADPQNETYGTNHFYFDSDDQRIRVNSERQAGPTDPGE